MKIFGKSLKEYIFPIWYYIAGAILIVVSQYYVAVPLRDEFPFLLNITQGLWIAMVALSVIKLIRKHDFNFKQVLFVGVLYCFIIHGLKAFFFRAFLFPYTHIPSEQIPIYLLEKFLYGSFLVMSTVIIIATIFIYLKKKELLKD